MQHNQGRIVILNGAPRSGKSSIATALQHSIPGTWIALGVDLQSLHMIPQDLRPGIGLRPGGERPDLEPVVERLYRALYKSIRAYAEEGFDVVTDLGHHQDYATLDPLLPQCARLLSGLDVLFVGVSASLETILQRRATGSDDRPGLYAQSVGVDVPAPILRWQQAVHAHGQYDLEIDTDVLNPDEAAHRIGLTLANRQDGLTAFERLAKS
jgi:chloramphenicol 3-O phosphotransferase